MTTYSESAYSDDDIGDALEQAGYPRDAFKRYVAERTTEGRTLTDIAEGLGLHPPRFWAYYQQWCGEHAEPLRLGVEDTDD